MANQDRTERPLDEIFFPRRSTLPSYFNLPAFGANVNLKLGPHYGQMLPQFIGLEGACLFLSEFEEVCI